MSDMGVWVDTDGTGDMESDHGRAEGIRDGLWFRNADRRAGGIGWHAWRRLLAQAPADRDAQCA